MRERTIPAAALAVALAVSPLTAPAKSRIVYPHSPCFKGSRLPGCAKPTHSVELRPYTPKKYEDHGLEDTMTPLGRKARGFYITPYYMFKVPAAAIARMMKQNGLNAVVLDAKDDLGRVLWPSKVPLAKRLQHHLLPDPEQTIKTLHDSGIYVIARLVAFKDSRLPYHRPDLAARIGPGGRRLLSAGANWLDAYSAEVQDYLVDLALELQGLGFDEVQLDYIRFPKGIVSQLGVWLHKDNRDRATLISDFLERMDRALTIPMSVDVYGLTTLVDGDPRELGQTIENMGRHVEALSPMMYANGMDTYFKDNKVTEHVYNIIQCGLWRARHKVPHVVLRPYLQAYPNNVEHFFGPDFISKQVVAAERAGSNGFLFWNPGMRNGVTYWGLRKLGLKKVEAFGDDPDQYQEPKNNPGPWCKPSGAGEVFTKTRRKAAAPPSP